MTKEVRNPVSPLPEKPAGVTKRSAVLAALSLLSASMGLSLSDEAKGEITQDVTVNKAKTADKAFSAMDGYIRGRVKPGSTGPTAPPKPAGGGSHRK